MCVLFFAYKKHQEYPLVIAANRDEFYDRPTAPAHFWEDEPMILAGRDLKQLGTWIGITKNGRFAALTNYRDPSESVTNKTSRGHIIRDYLSSLYAPENFLHRLKEKRDNFQGFNLIVGNTDSLWYYSNVQNEIKRLIPGIYGLSNHLLDTPWPKVEKGKLDMEECLRKADDIDRDCLFELLNNRDRAVRSELPETGIGIDWEEKLSSIFIQTEKYGTRSSTVMTINKNQLMDFRERSLTAGEKHNVHLTFRIQE
ncbi:NRDE family protein [Pseudalkalibacillus sp. R45]|uniref:NRDE family protein n=1 Tax=Pseudalkalibacillus sp. R45 TaxID=3457433 RepID=UPI003FCE94B0